MKTSPESLHEQGLISEESLGRIKEKEANPSFSLHWELRTVLYLGVLLFTTGVGILVYQNIDTIGHQAILAFIALACMSCFFYCFKQGNSYSPERVEHPSPFFDYVLLLGSLLFLTFEGYVQYQYQVFGDKYDIAAILPTFLFFFLAYRFDHLGILSMAITGLAAWLGLSITPLHLFDSFDLSSQRLIFTGEILGVGLGVAGWLLSYKLIKTHFFYTYLNFSTHLLFVSTLSGLFLADDFWILTWFVWLVALVTASYYHAKKEKSFYFLLIAILYGYIGLTYVFFKTLDAASSGDTIIWLGFWYFMASCTGIILFLVNHKKIVGKLFD